MKNEPWNSCSRAAERVDSYGFFKDDNNIFNDDSLVCQIPFIQKSLTALETTNCDKYK